MNRTTRKIFGREAIEKMLEEIGDALEGEVRAVLIGGGAMSLKGKKSATKDVDIAIVSPTEHKIFLDTLLRLGFTRTMNFDEKMLIIANSMEDSPVFVNRDGAHLDIFPDTVCKRFHIHEGIIRRAKKAWAIS